MHCFNIFNCNPVKKPKLPTETAPKLNETEQQRFFRFKEQLSKSKQIHAIDDKRFAHVLGDAVIRGTSFEGGNYIEAYEYWKKVLEEIKAGKGPLATTIEQSVLDAIMEDINDLIVSYKLLTPKIPEAKNKSDKVSDNLFDRRMKAKHGPNSANDLLKAITDGLEKRGRFVLSLGHQGTGFAEGHRFIGVITKDPTSNKLICTFLNKGEGLEMHEPDEFRSHEYVFKDPDIFKPGSEVGQTLITILQSFETSETAYSGHPHASKEIYELISQVAEKQPVIQTASPLTLITPQRGGSCSEQAVRLVIRDLISSNSQCESKEKEFKRIIYSGKYQALFEGMHESKIALELFKRGIEEFANSTRKMIDKGYLNLEEATQSWALIELAKTELEMRKLDPGKKITLPSLAGPVAYHTTFKEKIESSQLSNKVAGSKIEKSSEFFEWAPLKPETVAQELQRLLKYPTTSQRASFELPRWVENLPIPIAESDAFWDKVPQEHIQSCVNSLSQFADAYKKAIHKEQYDRRLSNSQGFPKTLLAVLTLYSVIDKLARRMPENNLNGFMCSVPLDDIGNKFFLRRGNESLRLAQIRDYFKQVAKQHKARIFPYIWEKYCINSEKIYDLKEENQGVIGDHLMFIDQFIKKEGVPAIPSEYFKRFGINYSDKQSIPESNSFHQAINLLKYFADASFHMIALSRIDGIGKEDILSDALQGIDVEIESLNGNSAHVKCISKIKDIEKKYSKGLYSCLRIGSLSPYPVDELLDPAKDSENAIMLSPEWRYCDKELTTDLKKVAACDALRIPLLVKWCREARVHLERQDTRNLIELFLLNKTHLMDSLKQEPLLIHSLRTMIDNQIESIQFTCRYGEVLDWLMLAIHVESHLSMVTDSFDQDRVNQLHQTLRSWHDKAQVHYSRYPEAKEREGFEYAFCASEAYLLGLQNNLTPEQTALFLSDILLMVYYNHVNYKHENEWLKYDVQQAFYRHWPQIQKSLSSSKELLLSSLAPMAKHLGIEIKDATLSFPSVSFVVGKDKYTCNFELATTMKNSQVIQKGNWMLNRLKDMFPIHFREGLSEFCYFKNYETGECYYETTDGNFRAINPKNWGDTPDIFKKFDIDGKQLFCRYMDTRMGWDWAWKLGIPSKLFSNNYAWLQEEGPIGARRHLFIQSKDGTPYATAIFNPETGTVIIERSVKGKKPERLVDLPPEHPLLKFLHLFDYCDGILAWGRDRKKGPEISSFELANFDNLRFNVQESPQGPIAVSENFSGYCLSQEQGIFSGSQLPGALNLEMMRDPDQKLVIIPYTQFGGGEKWSEPFRAFFNGSMNGGDSSEKNYIVYEVDGKTGKLIPSTQESYLFLIKLMISLNRYKEALEYLEQLNWSGTLSNKESDFLSSIANFNDFSPEGISFKLKLALKVCELEEMHHFSRLQKPIIVEGTFWSSIEKALRIRNQKPATYDSHIPLATSYLISQKEMQKINKKLGKKDTRSDVKSGLFDGHDSLFAQKETLHSIYNQLHDPHFHKRFHKGRLLDEFKKFTRFEPLDLLKPIKYEQLLKSFYTLFEEVKNPANKSIDLKLFYFFQSLNRTNNEHYQDLDNFTPLYLLYLVRNYPDVFANITANDFKNNPQRVAELFLECIAKASKDPNNNIFPLPKKHYYVSRKRIIDVPAVNPQRPIITQAQSSIDLPFVVTQPLKKILADNFRVTPKPVFKGTERQFALAESRIAGHDPITKNVIGKLQDGFQNLVKDKSYSEYLCITDAFLLQKNLEDHLKSLKKDAANLENEIEKLLHPSIEEGLSKSIGNEQELQKHRLELAGGKKKEFNLNDTILSFALSKDRKWVLEQNPLLTDTQIDELYSKLTNYLLTSSAIDQTKEALQETVKAIEDKENQAAHLIQAGAILGKRRNYDPKKEPVLLLYEYASGFMLRTEPDQARLLRLIFEMIFKGINTPEAVEELRQLFFEFQAGGGKTKVIAAIIAIMAVIMGKCPIFISLPEIFDITKKDLQQSFSRFFSKKVAQIDFALNTPMTAKKLSKIAHRLQKGLKNGDFFVITPETLYALKLDYQVSLSKGDVEKVKWHSEIEDFFKKHTLALIDEIHRNAFSLFQANVAMGIPRQIDDWEQGFILYCMNELMGLSKDPIKLRGKPIQEVFNVRGNTHASATKETKKEVLSALADRILNSTWLQNSYTGIEQKNQLKEYLLNLDMDMPSEIPKEKLQPVFLARGLLCFILPHTLGMVGEMDHGLPINPEDELEAPRKQKNPTTARFELPDVAAILSVQGRFQRGLATAPELLQLVEHMKKLAMQENVQIGNLAETPTAKLFMQWQEGAEIKINLEEINKDNPYIGDLLDELAKTLGKHIDAIVMYLTTFVLPQVQIYPYKITATAQDLMHSFFSAIMFSATLGTLDQYQTVEGMSDRFLEDLAFPAEVIQRACLEHNSLMHWISQGSPKQLFEELYKRDPSLFNRIEGCLDMGGRTKNYSGLQCATDFLDFAKHNNLPYEGATFFEREKLPNGKLGEKFLYYIDQKTRELKKLQGTNIPKAEKGRIFKVYGPEDTTGTDITLSPDAAMLFMLGEGATFSLMVQTIMRMRLFLQNPIDPKWAQSLIWIGTPELHEKIKSEIESITKEALAAVTPKECFEWGILNEVDIRRKTIVQRAFQEIDYEIRELVWQQVRGKPPEEQIKINKLHEKAFQKELGRDLLKLYGLTSIEGSTKDALDKYADYLAGIACVKELKNYPQVKKRIDRIAMITAGQVSTIRQKAAQDLSCCGQMQSEVVKVQKKEEEAESLQEAKSLEESRFNVKDAAPLKDYPKNSLSLSSKDLVLPRFDYHRRLNEVINAAGIPANLTIADNVLNTVKDKTVYKPAEFFLVVEEDGHRHAMIVSVDDANLYLQQLQKEHFQGRRIALFTSDGGIVARSQSDKPFSDNDIYALQKSDWFQSIIASVALFSLKIRQEKRMYKLYLDQPKEIVEIWKTLKEGAIYISKATKTRLDSLFKVNASKPTSMPSPLQETFAV